MSDYTFPTKAGVAISVNVPIKLDVTGAALTFEFSDRSNFSVIDLSKNATGAGRSVTINLTASEIDRVKDSYYRVKSVIGGKTTIVLTGQIDYVAAPVVAAPVVPGLTASEVNAIVDTKIAATVPSTFTTDQVTAINTMIAAKIAATVPTTSQINTMIDNKIAAAGTTLGGGSTPLPDPGTSGGTGTTGTGTTGTGTGGTGTTTPTNVPPVASFTTVKTGLSVTATSTATDSDGTIATRTWAWGDNTATSTGASSTHNYASAGTYTVTHTVTDNSGATTSTTSSVTVAPLNVAPTAGFTFTKANLAVTATSTATDSDGTIASTSYNWGDGSAASSTPAATHTYAAAGTYTITQTVTDNSGATATSTASVTVVAPSSGAALWSYNSRPTAVSITSTLLTATVKPASGTDNIVGSIPATAWYLQRSDVAPPFTNWNSGNAPFSTSLGAGTSYVATSGTTADGLAWSISNPQQTGRYVYIYGILSGSRYMGAVWDTQA